MKKFLYKNNLNQTTEASLFEPDDYINSFSATPGLPVITNSSGVIDSTLLPAISAAAKLQESKLASVIINKGDLLYSTSATHVGIATNNMTLPRAMVLGVALNDAGIGQTVGVALLGSITDPLFSVFTVNQLLYLDEDGAITDTKPTSGFLTAIGKSLGSNSIFIQVGYPTQLGA